MGNEAEDLVQVGGLPGSFKTKPNSLRLLGFKTYLKLDNLISAFSFEVKPYNKSSFELVLRYFGFT